MGRFNGLRAFALIALQATAGLCSLNAEAQDYGLIDRVSTVAEASGDTNIQIDFLEPVQYTGHSPQSSGTRVFVDVRHLRGSGRMLLPEQHQRPKGVRSPLKEVIYRARGGSAGQLELVFDTETRFQVASDGDSRRLLVRVLNNPSALRSLISASETDSALMIAGDSQELMDNARRALLSDRDYPRAAELYAAVLERGESEFSRTALEYLGITRERMGERQAAIICYQRYLQSYTGPQADVDRVRQRMLSVETAIAMTPQVKLATPSEGAGEDTGWELNGALYQYYLHDDFTVDGGDTRTTGSAVNTDLDFLARRRGEQNTTEVRVNAGHYYDLLDDRNSTSSRVNTLYVHHGDTAQNWWVRAGRQTGRRDGVLGRFDGVKSRYALSDRIAVTAVGGTPVDNPRNAPDGTRYFVGAALQLDSIFDALDISLYALEQRNDQLIDRRAVGTEIRYFSPTLSAFGVIDYDVFYQELNIGMLNLNWTPTTATSFNLSADTRLLPMLTTQNSLQGQIDENFQAVDGIAGMLDRYTDDEVYQFAADRTVRSQSLTLGASQALSEKLRLSMDLTSSSMDQTVESGGVPALPETGSQYFGSLMLSGVDVMGINDFTTLGLRWSDTSSVTSQGVFAMGRVNLFEYWQVYARLAYDQRSWIGLARDEQRITPRLRLQFRRWNMQFEAELGARWSDIQYPDDTENSLALFASLGYRYDF
ncbi:tetratricopeptide repeat protein [Congregibacter sp.]|uniref:tetratricopeptide repeat protein n=1 Tax=Congregibacter sp. TaxID=2744308 RepID=UPI003F6B1142